jgi:porin
MHAAVVFPALARAAQPVASASPAASSTPAVGSTAVEPISSNPGAVNIITGTGLLGRTIGLDEIPGIRLGGLWIVDADYLITGGLKPRTWSFNSALMLDLNLDAAKLLDIPGGSLGVEMLQFDGAPANQKAGVVTGYDGLTEPKPLDRTELYELWWRQSFFEDLLVLRVGKTIPTYDFNSVTRPVPTSDPSLKIPSVSALISTGTFKNPTLIGAMPGYYNSAYGITATCNATRNLYLKYAVYDGSLATGVQTGLREFPTFDGHYFTIGEAGYSYILGENALPGMVAAGGWGETGRLHGGGENENGAEGFYTFGSQRLWREHPGVDNDGVSGFFQFGINDSRTRIANEYFGMGFTGFGLIPRRPVDSIGTGVAWSWLNRIYGFRSNEAIIQLYYQAHLIGTTFFQPTLSYIPNPGANPGVPGALAITSQLTVLF